MLSAMIDTTYEFYEKIDDLKMSFDVLLILYSLKITTNTNQIGALTKILIVCGTIMASLQKN